MKKLMILALASLIFVSCENVRTVMFENPQPANQGELLSEFPKELMGVWNKTNDIPFDEIRGQIERIQSKIKFSKKGKLKRNKYVKIQKNGLIKLYLSKNDTITFKNTQHLDSVLRYLNQNKELLKVESNEIKFSVIFKWFFIDPLINGDDKFDYLINEDVILKKWNGNYFINRKVYPLLNDSCVPISKRNSHYWETFILNKNKSGHWDFYALHNPWNFKSERLLKDDENNNSIADFNLNELDVNKIINITENKLLTFKGDSILQPKNKELEYMHSERNDSIVLATDDLMNNTDDATTGEYNELERKLINSKKYDDYNDYIECYIGEKIKFNLFADTDNPDRLTNYDPSSLESSWRGVRNNDSIPIGLWKKSTSSGDMISYVNFNEKGEFDKDFEIKNNWGELIVKGSFSNNLKYGKWIFNNPYNGKRVEGYYDNNLKTNEWSWYLNDMKYRIASYTNDELNGKYVLYNSWIDSVPNLSEEGEFRQGTRLKWKVYELADNSEELEYEEDSDNNLDEDNNILSSDNLINNPDSVTIKIKDSKASIYSNKGNLLASGNCTIIDSSFTDQSIIKTSEIRNFISREGVWTFYYLNGNERLVGEFCCNDSYCGTWKKFYPNGKLEYSINLVNGDDISLGRPVKVGNCKYYSKNGTLIKESLFSSKSNYYISELKRNIYWENGMIREKYVGSIWGATGQIEEYYDNGQLKKVYNAIDNQLNGKYQEYYENGSVKVDANFVIVGGKGVINGVFSEFFENGKLKSKCNFNKGIPIGNLEVFHENGLLYIQGGYSEIHSVFGENPNIEIYNLGENPSDSLIYEIVDGELDASNLVHYAGRTTNYYSIPKGDWKFYYPNGKLEKVGKFENFGIETYDIGSLMKNEYTNRFLQNDFEYLENGEEDLYKDPIVDVIQKIGYYKILVPNGSKIKPWKYFDINGKEIKQIKK